MQMTQMKATARKLTFARLVARMVGQERWHDLFAAGIQIDHEELEEWPLYQRIWFYLQAPNDRREEIACQIGRFTGIVAVGADSYWEIIAENLRDWVIGWRCWTCKKWKHEQWYIGGKCHACSKVAMQQGRCQ